MMYRHGKRPARDITREADFSKRPTCPKCGKVMRKTGMSRGRQKWRCITAGVTCWSQVGDSANARLSKGEFPGVDRMREMLATMTYVEIARQLNVNRHTISNWVSKHNLAGASPHGQHKREVMVPDNGAMMFEWARREIGAPAGGSGWHNMAGIEMVREVIRV